MNSTSDTELAQLRRWTTVVADSGDIEAIARLRPAEATTNPTLILRQATAPGGERFLRAARAHAESPEERLDRVVVSYGVAILEHISGRVSTEVDARLSFDARRTVTRARRLISLYRAEGIDRERVLIKIAATWEGAEAARILEREGVHCNLTLIFSLVQARLAAQAGATLISPFVGRIRDWYQRRAGAAWDAAAMVGDDDPGVRSVREIWRYLKSVGSPTQVMGASFRDRGEILALAGCDLLTIAPKFIDELAASRAPLTRALDPATVRPAEDRPLSEPDFRYQLNACEMAGDCLAQGIRSFAADSEKLASLLT